MDWFLYDNGLRHERVNMNKVLILYYHYWSIEKFELHSSIFCIFYFLSYQILRIFLFLICSVDIAIFQAYQFQKFKRLDLTRVSSLFS